MPGRGLGASARVAVPTGRVARCVHRDAATAPAGDGESRRWATARGTRPWAALPEVANAAGALIGESARRVAHCRSPRPRRAAGNSRVVLDGGGELHRLLQY